jgi:hypothetical protein
MDVGARLNCNLATSTRGAAATLSAGGRLQPISRLCEQNLGIGSEPFGLGGLELGIA